MMRFAILIALISHSVFSFYSLTIDGYFSVFPPFKELWAAQMFSDLGIALGLVLCFLYAEAKRKNEPLLGVALCGIGMIFLGSISPMVYILLRRELFKPEIV